MCPSSSLFQPTLPLRGATSRRCRPSREASCFNPRSPCGERRASGAWRLTKPPVFQPTLPLRGATRLAQLLQRALPFQPTLPLRGATRLAQLLQRALPFQPTLPLRGATPAYRRPRSCRSCFNPRSPCGERPDPSCRRSRTATRFNPRSPCGERLKAVRSAISQPGFNPRSPCGERPAAFRSRS